MNPQLSTDGTFLLRVWRPELAGPSVCTLRDGRVIDITCPNWPTVSDLMNAPDPAAALMAAEGEDIGSYEEILEASTEAAAKDQVHLLSPNDLQAIKACGVTFAGSMVERVIEEQAAGDPEKAEAIRAKIGGRIGDSLSNIVPGSEESRTVKEALLAEGLWSQYLEVGIGPDAEVFTKSQPLSAVGAGASVGLHPMSKWNNPEPEVVLVVNSRGEVHGATLGNDVNLRDIEGRSALLLGKAKDNNASCAIGPAIRLFDSNFTMDDVRKIILTLHVSGPDGFELTETCALDEISRDPLDLVAQTMGRHHQYPEGIVLFLGSLFAPIQDRKEPGSGFTHVLGDVVKISCPELGTLQNTVRLSTECPPWDFGSRALMRNLAKRGLL